MSSTFFKSAPVVARKVARVARLTTRRVAVAVAASVMIFSSMPTAAIAEVTAEQAQIAQQGQAIDEANAKADAEAAKKAAEAKEASDKAAAEQAAEAKAAAEKAAAEQKAAEEKKAAEEQAQKRILVYNGNGAAGKMDDTVFKVGDGEKVTVVKNAFARDGYEFTGWSTTSNNEDVKGQDGTVTMKAVFVPADTQLKGMKFEYDVNGDGTVADDEKFDLTDCVRDQAITLYAQWENLAEKAAREAAAKEAELKALAERQTEATSDEEQKQEQAADASVPDNSGQSTDTPATTDAAAKDDGTSTSSDAQQSDAGTAADEQGAQSVDAADQSVSQKNRDAGTTTVDASNVLDGSKLNKKNRLIAAPSLTQAQLASLAAVSSITPGHEDEKPEGDGTKIESISSKWITPDNWPDNDKDLLSLKLDDDTPFDIKLQVDVNFSGQYDYNPGDLQLSISKNFVSTRDGVEEGIFELSVPESPDSKAVFSYTDMGDYYLLTNVRKLSAATSAMFQFAVREITPHKVYGNQFDEAPANKDDGVKADDAKRYTKPFEATIQVITHAGNILSKNSNSLNARFDTKETIDKTEVTEYKTSMTWPDSWPTELKPANPDDYIYIDWGSWTTQNGNQEYSMDVTHDLTSSENVGVPQMLGILMPDGTVVANPNKGSASQTATLVPSDDPTYVKSGTRGYYTHAYAAYPKKDWQAGNLYQFKDKVTYTLTSTDDKQVTKATDDAVVEFRPELMGGIPGDFNVTKSGGYEYINSLNKLLKGEDVLAQFDVGMEGFAADYTLAPNSNDPATLGQRSYKMVASDYKVQFDNQEEALTSKDFDFASVGISSNPKVYQWKQFTEPGMGWKDYGGVFSWVRVNVGEWAYAYDDDISHWPDVEISAQFNGTGEFRRMGTASWKTGKMVLTADPAGGASVNTESPDSLVLPENVTQIQTSVTTNVGGYSISFHPTVRLKSTEATRARVQALFENSHTPKTILRNWASMNSYQAATVGGEPNQYIGMSGPRLGADELTGAGTGVKAYKDLRYTNNQSRQGTELHYTLGVREHSNLPTLEEYYQAIKDGVFQQERGGYWYDLLPKDVIPNLSSVKATREGDAVTAVKTIENYKGSGRTLLIVRTSLTPQPKWIVNGDSLLGVGAYGDEFQIEFDAFYSWSSVATYGTKLNNVFGFESDNDQIGSVKGLMGEPDNPRKGNNEGSASATQGVEDIMTNLDEKRDTNSFVYANSANELSLVSSAATGLQKSIDTNDSGAYSQGLGDSDQRNVYEGGVYSYRISTTNTGNTKTKDLVFYDNLENYRPGVDKYNGTDQHPEDTGDQQWRGHLLGVDVSPLIEKGVQPKVYYSTKAGLKLSDTDNRRDQDLTNADIWSTTPPANLDDVTAIAIDASKGKDGEDFVLDVDGSLMAYIRMRAPHVDDDALGGAGISAQARLKWYDTSLNGKTEAGEDGLFGGAHAYNNVTRVGTEIDAATNEVSEQNKLITYDYTKVGLLPFQIEVKKKWTDNNNQDGKRPDSVRVYLTANGEKTDNFVTLDASNDWMESFGALPVLDNDGKPIYYSVVDEVHGYMGVPSIEQGEKGLEITLDNRYTPSVISISGTKEWDGDADQQNARPESIKLDLYADGVKLKSQVVKPANRGADKWDFTFDNLPEYKDGKKVNYEVREDTYYPGYVTSITTDPVTGTTVRNTYRPYGDLRIEKAVEDATDLARDKDFAFTVGLYKPGNDSSDLKPDGGTYTWEKKDVNGQVIETGKVGHGGTLKLKGGQSVTIKDIPSETTYQVTEQETPGFTQSNVSGSIGIIKAGEERTAVAHFINTYSAKGFVSLGAHKTLTGRDLVANQFRFELVDAQGTVISSAANAADGSVLFGRIYYTLAVAGKTFTYYIREAEGGQNGYIYDSAQRKVEVSVADNGDGTLTATPKYFDKDGSVTENNGTAVPEIANAYKAKGSLSLRAWKTLTGGDLKADEFSFTLTPQGDAPMPDTDKDGKPDASVTVNNAADGTISFPEISLTQENVGKTYTYAASEVVPKKGEEGYNTGVTYDTKTFTYTVTVRDNGDGTLSYTQTTSESPVFKNALKPGGFEIRKYVPEDKGNGDPNQEFEFHVQLTSKDGQKLPEKLKYEHKQLTAPKADATADESQGSETRAVGAEEAQRMSLAQAASGIQAATQAQPANAAGTLAAVANVTGRTTVAKAVSSAATSSLVVQAPAEAASTIVANGTWKAPIWAKNEGVAGSEGALWTLDSDGTMVIKPASGDFALVNAATFARPWYDSTYKIKSIKFEGTVQPRDANSENEHADVNGLFSSTGRSDALKEIESINVTGLDLSKVSRAVDLFAYNEKLKEVVFPSGFDLMSATNISGWFDKCAALNSIDLSNIKTSDKLERMASLFSECTSLQTVVFGTQLDTSGVKSMNQMFKGCSSLATINNMSFDTSKVTNLLGMFNGCSSLETLDLTTFDTTSAGGINNFFRGMKSLKSITLGPKFVSLKDSQLPAAARDGYNILSGYTGKWIRKGDSQSYSASDLMEQWDPVTMAGTYTWEVKKTNYTVRFDANADGDAVSGSVADQTWNLGAPSTMPQNSYYRFGYKFTGWNRAADGSGLSYQPGDTPTSDLTHTAGETVTLYAQWQRLDSSATVTDGGFDLTLRGNEAAVFKDLPAGVGYNVYEKTPAGWVLVRSSDTTGVVKPNEYPAATFTNEYSPTKTSAQITAMKTMDGEPARAGFTFQLFETGSDFTVASNATALQTVQNADGGAIQFESITYPDEARHYYVIREVKGSDADVATWDAHDERVTVNVTRDASGNLKAKVAYDNNGAAFDNKPTETSGKGKLTLAKAVEGTVWNDQTFKFTVTWDDGTKDDVTLSADVQTWTSSEHAAGTHFTIKEDNAAGFTEGFVEDGKVTDGTGAITNGDVVVTVTNSYAASGSVNVKIQKKLEGGTLTAGQFEFGLYESDSSYTFDESTSKLLGSAYNEADGTVTFDALSYVKDKTKDDAGTHYYVVHEIADNNDVNIDYSTDLIHVKVTVGDNGNGTLKAVAEYPQVDGNNQPIITNKVKPGYLEISKVVEGTDAARKHEFSFALMLTDAAGQPYASDVTYTVRDTETGQQVGQAVKVTPDTGGKVMVNLKHGQTAKLELPAGTTYQVAEVEQNGFTGEIVTGKGLSGEKGIIEPGEDAVTKVSFKNVYVAEGSFSVAASKQLVGLDSLTAGQFTFRLVPTDMPGREDEEGKPLEATNDADGNIKFSDIDFTDADSGKTFVFELQEAAGGDSTIVYDETIVTVRVRPVDNGDGTMTIKATYTKKGEDEAKDASGALTGEKGSGESGWTFVNYKKIVLPEAGGRGIMLGAGAGLLLVLGCAAWVARRRMGAGRWNG